MEAQTLKVLLQFGEQVEIRCCQVTDIGRMGKNFPVSSVEEVHCGASNVWPVIIVQQQYSKLKKHFRGPRFLTVEDVQEEVRRWLRLQNASCYCQGSDSLIYRYDKCLKRYGDYVDKQTVLVPVSNPCVTYSNLFIFQIINKKPYFLTSPRAF
jgi:hypothetical protein